MQTAVLSSSAAVAHRDHAAPPRSAGAGRCGALRCGAVCPEMQPVCSQQTIWSPVSRENTSTPFYDILCTPHTCFLSCGHVLTLNQTLFIQQLLNETIAIQSTAQEAGATQQWVQRGINTESHINTGLHITSARCSRTNRNNYKLCGHNDQQLQ